MFKLLFADMRKNLKLFFGTFIAVVVATAIITACLNLVFSSTADFSNGYRFSNVDLVLIANQDIIVETVDDSGDIETEREELSGRKAITDERLNELKTRYNIIEDYTFYIKPKNIVSEKIAGHNISAINLTGFSLSGTVPSDNQIVIDENLAERNSLKIGDSISINTNSALDDFEISGVVSSTGKEDYSVQNYIFFSDDVAKENANGVLSVAIIDENVTENDFNEDEYEVFVGEDTNEAELSYMVSNDMSLMVIFITMGSVCLVISLFVISGTMQFSIKNRFRLLAQLRIVGLKKSQINRILTGQTLIVSLFASVCGVIISIPLANVITYLYCDMGIISSGFTADFSILWSGAVALFIIILSMIVTVITAKKPLLLPPASAIKSEGEVLGKTSVLVIIFGVIFVLGGIAILMFTPMTQGLGIGMVFCASTVLLGGAICLMPIVVKFINIMLSVITKSFSKSLGGVAYGNINMKASKFAVAAVSIAIMMSMGSVMLLSNESYIGSSARNNYDFASEYQYVTNDKLYHEIAEFHEVFAVKNTSFLVRQGENINDYSAVAVLGDTPKVSITSKKFDVDDKYIWVADTLKDVEVGDVVNVNLENGEEAEFVVGGKFEQAGIADENYSFIVDYDYIKHSLYSENFSTVYSQAQLFEDSVLNTMEYYKNSVSYDIQYAASLLLGFIGLILSVVALFNTFFVIMSVRTSEFNKLKLVGAKKGQILKMTVTEVLIIITTGMIIGFLVLASCVGSYSLANVGEFDFIVNPTIFWGMIAVTFVLGLIAGILPSVLTIGKLKRQFRDE